MSARVDIIIPTFNQSEYTIRCLESIKKHTKDYRIIWIENGSEKDEVAAVKKVIKSMPHFAILNTENLGFVKGVNQGIASATAPFVVFLNNDTEVTHDWVEKLMSTFDNPKIGLVGCVTNAHGSWQGVEHAMRSLNVPLPPWGHYENADAYNAFLEKNYMGQFRIVPGMVAFFCTMIRRDVFKKVGYLSEEYGIGLGDDDDFCERARVAGIQIACRIDTLVFHNHRTTFKSMYSAQELAEAQKRNISFFKVKHGK